MMVERSKETGLLDIQDKLQDARDRLSELTKKVRKGELVLALEVSDRLIGDAAVVRKEIVDELRADGLSWASIGALLGVTAQAVQQRFGTGALRAPSGGPGDSVVSYSLFGDR